MWPLKTLKKEWHWGALGFLLVIGFLVIITQSVNPRHFLGAIDRKFDENGHVIQMVMNDNAHTVFTFTYDGDMMIAVERRTTSSQGIRILSIDLLAPSATDHIGDSQYKSYEALVQEGTGGTLDPSFYPLAQWKLLPGGPMTFVHGRLIESILTSNDFTTEREYVYDNSVLTKIEEKIIKAGQQQSETTYDLVNLEAVRLKNKNSQSFYRLTIVDQGSEVPPGSEILGSFILSADGKIKKSAIGSLKKYVSLSPNTIQEYDENHQLTSHTMTYVNGSGVLIDIKYSFTYEDAVLVRAFRTMQAGNAPLQKMIADFPSRELVADNGRGTISVYTILPLPIGSTFVPPSSYRKLMSWYSMSASEGRTNNTVAGILLSNQATLSDGTISITRFLPNNQITVRLTPDLNPISAIALNRSPSGQVRWSQRYDNLEVIDASLGVWSESVGKDRLFIDAWRELAGGELQLSKIAVYGTALKTCFANGSCIPPSKGSLPHEATGGWGMNTRELSEAFWPLFAAVMTNTPADPLPPFDLSSAHHSAVLNDLEIGVARVTPAWSLIQPRSKNGEFVWGGMDKTMDYLRDNNIRPLVLLMGVRSYFTNNLTPVSPEHRQIFLNYISKVVNRYKNRNVIWELWNEPNNRGNWEPAPSAEEYAVLAKYMSNLIRTLDPTATIVGPGLSHFDPEYLEILFKNHFLLYVDAISIHPYRFNSAEGMIDEIDALRTMIDRYAPPGKVIPITTTEFGWQTEPTPLTTVQEQEEIQSKNNVRQLLIQTVERFPVNTLFEFMEGPSSQTIDHSYGVVRYDLTPKAGYENFKTLKTTLSALPSVTRMKTDNEADWKLLFFSDTDAKIVSWSNNYEDGGTEPVIEDVSPTAPEIRRLANIRYSETSVITHDMSPGVFGITIRNTEDTPATMNILFLGENRALALNAGASETVWFTVSAPTRRDSISTEVPVEVTWNGEIIEDLAPVRIVRSGLLDITAVPQGSGLKVYIVNEDRIPFFGTLVMKSAEDEIIKEIPITIDMQRLASFSMPLASEYSFELRDPLGNLVFQTPQRTVEALNFSGAKIRYSPGAHMFVWTGSTMSDLVWSQGAVPNLQLFYGSSLHIVGTGSVAYVEADLQQIPVSKSPMSTALEYKYYFPGRGHSEAVPQERIAVPQNVKSARLWIKGDLSNNRLMTLFVDHFSEAFTVEIGKIIWNDWRPVIFNFAAHDDKTKSFNTTVTLPDNNKAVVDFPIRWIQFLRVNSLDLRGHTGSLLIAPAIEWEY